MNPSVAVVILNWNGKAYLKQFLPGILLSEYDNLQIVVGDNASTDDSVSFLQENFPTVKIIQNDQNYGFAGGYNKVLERVEADYFILLNSDVEVTPNWIKPVIDLMESDAQIAAAQPKIKWQLNKKQFEYAGAAGGYLDIYSFPFCFSLFSLMIYILTYCYTFFLLLCLIITVQKYNFYNDTCYLLQW